MSLVDEKTLRDRNRLKTKIVFDDGHNTGLYSWEYLHELAKNYKEYWHDYLEKLNNAGYVRSKP